MKISEWKKIVLNIFLFLFIFTLFFEVYTIFNPLAFPGLVERLAWALFCVGTITAVLYIPHERVIPLMNSFYVRVLGRFGRKKRRTERTKIFFVNFGIRHFVSREEYVKRMFNLVFQVLLVGFLFALLVQQFSPEILFFDMNYFLITVIVFGIIAVLTGEERDGGRKGDLEKGDYIFSLLAGIAGSFIIGFKLQELGMIGLLISCFSGFLIALLSLLLLKGE